MHKLLRKVLSYVEEEQLPPDWSLVSVGDVVLSAQYGLNTPSSHDGQIPIVGMKDIREGRVLLDNLARTTVSDRELQAYRLHKGDLLINRTNSLDQVGKVGIVEEDRDIVFASYLVRLVSDRSKIDPEFLNLWLNSDIAQRTIKRIATPAIGQANLNPTEFQKYCLVPLPPINDQRRITEILSTWGRAIEKTERLIAAKDLRIRAVCIQIFERAMASHDELLPARDLLKPVSERGRPDLPLLAVMQDVGVVRRDELNRRVTMPEGDISTYKVVRPGDFIISLRSFEGGLEYSEVEGLVSPAYTVLRSKAELVPDYYRHFFKSTSFIGRLDRLIFGIRDGKQIAFRDFGDMKIPCPAIEKQQLASVLLNVANRDANLSRRLFHHLCRQKRSLIQKLLIGKWRLAKQKTDLKTEAPGAAEGVAL